MKQKSFFAIIEESKLNESFTETIAKVLETKKLDIKKKIMIEEEDTELHFQDLHWRVDIEIASKTKSTQVIPKFLIDLKLNQGKKPIGIAMECNYANMKKLKDELQLAVNSISQPYGRKIQKYAK